MASKPSFPGSQLAWKQLTRVACQSEARKFAYLKSLKFRALLEVQGTPNALEDGAGSTMGVAGQSTAVQGGVPFTMQPTDAPTSTEPALQITLWPPFSLAEALVGRCRLAVHADQQRAKAGGRSRIRGRVRRAGKGRRCRPVPSFRAAGASRACVCVSVCLCVSVYGYVYMYAGMQVCMYACTYNRSDATRSTPVPAARGARTSIAASPMRDFRACSATTLARSPH